MSVESRRNNDGAGVLQMLQVVSFDNLEDQELAKREVAEGLFLLYAVSRFKS